MLVLAPFYISLFAPFLFLEIGELPSLASLSWNDTSLAEAGKWILKVLSGITNIQYCNNTDLIFFGNNAARLYNINFHKDVSKKYY